MSEFKNNLKKLRMVKTLSQSELAKKTGFDCSYISHCETGRKKPGMENLVKFSKALECTIDQLVIGD